ncbi:EVE domain-containing protein [Archaeoglobales archaeon]|nr:MAG: EVE domain-containing protein [Archaeoglobales archaeon]
MAYWLCVTTEVNWKVIKEKNVWGVQERHRNTISKVKLGDKCLIYVMSTSKDDEVIPPRIVAVYEVASKSFTDRTRIFKHPKGYLEVFPLRIKLKPIKIFKEPIDFKSLVPQLKFIRNKGNWVGYIRGRAMREIPEEDFNLIISLAK